MFWVRKPASWQIGIWAVPTLGVQAKLYLEGAAEFDWSADGSRLTYQTTASGDLLWVSDGTAVIDDRDRLKTIHFVMAKLHADFFRVGVKGIPHQFAHGENRLRDADLPLKAVASNFDVDLPPLVRRKRTIL
jgi:hypothetical protein